LAKKFERKLLIKKFERKISEIKKIRNKKVLNKNLAIVSKDFEKCLKENF
jgi:hypothetical protein